MQDKYTAEKEDDMHHGQQISGAFGDSQYIDEATLHKLLQERNIQINPTFKENDFDKESVSDEYLMESAMFDYQELKQKDDFGIKKYQDAIYRGLIQNGKRHGNGVMIYRKNRVYEGEWLNDLRHGKGYERYSNNNKYEGDFQNGKAHGKGVYTWANGEIYDGEWRNGAKEGYGVWKGIFGDSYIGEWKNSKADGYGVHSWKNGDRYEGEWRNCLKHGQGTDIFANGDSYNGHYKEGKPDGVGQYKWHNGSIFVGEFKEGLKHGKGKWKKLQNSSNCNQYDGEYDKDKKNGYGVFQWESGNVYKGNYKDDERDGYGEMFWVDGSIYKGEWRKGIQHGQGKMQFSDGSIKEGLFENNVFVGNANPFNNPQIIPGSIIGGSTDLSSNRSSLGQRQIHSRGRSSQRQKTPAGQRVSQLKENGQIQKQVQLGPVQPPKKEINSSTDFGDMVNMGGYQSPLDSENGVIVPNLHFNYKMQPVTTRETKNNSMIFKRGNTNKSPMQKQTHLNISLNTPATTQDNPAINISETPKFLPDIKKTVQNRVVSKSSNRTQNTMSTDANLGIGMRRASPEALSIMMANLKNSQNSKKIWMPPNNNKKDKAKIKKFY